MTEAAYSSRAGQELDSISGPSTWTSASFRSADDFTATLPRQVTDEILELLARPGLLAEPLEQITLQRYPTPLLAGLMKDIHQELWDGRGFLVLRGLPVEGLSLQQLHAYYWLLCLHLGKPVSQNALGERISSVQDKTPPGGLQTNRGYSSRRELPLHTDRGDFMGLLCVRPAKSGGLSVGSSIHAVYNTMLQRRPDLVLRLMEGYPYHRRKEQQDDQPLITPYQVPVLAWVQGRLCSYYARPQLELALDALGRPPDPLGQEALDLFDEISWSDEHIIRFMMQPGDLYLANNWSTLHSRTEFEDHEEPEGKRLLLRMWMQRQPRTPVPREMMDLQNPSGDFGIDYKPGGKPAGPEFLVPYKQRKL